MKGRHVQTELSDAEYEAFRRASEAEGTRLKDALRLAALEWARRKRPRDDPLFDFVGSMEGSADASERHDAIYEED